MIALLFILGLAVGSFINAAVYRASPVPRESGGGASILRSLLYDRSRCPKCNTKLAWWQLVPILSFILLRAKCHYCAEKISWHYPIVELATALSFSGFYWLNYGTLSWQILVASLLVIALLVFIALYDYKYLLILDVTVAAGVVLALVIHYYIGNLLLHLIAGLGFAALLASLYILSRKRWLGFGDVKLALLIGLLGGPLTVITLLLASYAGSFVGLALIIANKGTLKTKLPFGTFLAVSAIAVLILEPYITYYLGQLFYAV